MTSITVANPDRGFGVYEGCFVDIYGPQPPSWWRTLAWERWKAAIYADEFQKRGLAPQAVPK